jgi:peptidoglycan biosynthesis protein MviN/MurJ (putative lipid II flippase)
LNKIIYSAGLIEKLLNITLGGIAIKILLNFLFVESMQQNGLALSTSISYIFFFFTSLILIYRRFSFKNKTIFFKELIFHLFNGLISLFIVKQISIIYQVNTFFILAEISLFLAIYILNIFLFKTTSTQIITGFFKNIKII